MNPVFITYGAGRYRRIASELARDAAETRWFAEVSALTPDDLEPAFRRRHHEVLRRPTGAGYFVWKPAILERTLARADDGQTVVYLDAGCSINARAEDRFREYVDIVEDDPKGWLSFQLTAVEEHHTNEAVFEFFGVPRPDPIRTTGQLVGGIHVVRRCDHALAVLARATSALEADPGLFTDAYDSYDPHGVLVAHRHDQSVLSVARKQMGSVVIADETWAEEWDRVAHVPFLATRRRPVGRVRRTLARLRGRGS